MRQAGEDFRSRFAVAQLDPLKSADSRQAGGSAAAPLQIWLGAIENTVSRQRKKRRQAGQEAVISDSYQGLGMI
jgi:hypothetical protein